MIKKVLWIGLLAFGILAGWYFVFKPYHLSLTFTTTEQPLLVYQHLLEWELVAGDSLEVEVKDRHKPDRIEHMLSRGDRTDLYSWHIRRIDSSQTKVRAEIRRNEAMLEEKWRLLWGNSALKSSALANVKAVYKGLKNKSSSYRVHRIKDSVREPVFCAYVELESHMTTKASAMHTNITTVMGYLRAHDIPLASDPFIEVTHWDRKSDSIRFNFCFPIRQDDSLPPDPEVRFKKSRAISGLKAEFNGNYRDSYKGWLRLLEVAKERDQEFSGLPVEVFLNDPQGAGDPLSWKAVIYLPLKDNSEL